MNLNRISYIFISIRDMDSVRNSDTGERTSSMKRRLPVLRTLIIEFDRLGAYGGDADGKCQAAVALMDCLRSRLAHPMANISPVNKGTDTGDVPGIIIR